MLAMVPYERESKLVSSPSPQPSPFWEVESTEERPRKKKNQQNRGKGAPDTHPKVLLQIKATLFAGVLEKSI